MIDLFAYRGVPAAARSIASGRLTADWLGHAAGRALQRFRVVALLSIGVMIVGIAAGALFL